MHPCRVIKTYLLLFFFSKFAECKYGFPLCRCAGYLNIHLAFIFHTNRLYLFLCSVLDFSTFTGNILVLKEHGIAVVSALGSGARGPGFDPACSEKFSWSEYTPLALLTGMMLVQCNILRIGLLTREALHKERHPLYSLKFPPVRQNCFIVVQPTKLIHC